MYARRGFQQLGNIRAQSVQLVRVFRAPTGATIPAENIAGCGLNVLLGCVFASIVYIFVTEKLRFST